MKKLKSTLLICTLLLLALAPLTAQVETSAMPGDQFSLEGALALFKEAQSPEDYEKLLNNKDNDVNNLDLNGDGQVDYIKVVDYVENEAHAVVLQVPISQTENQDIAVITIEKTGEQSAQIQIIGDEDVYGEELVVEPYKEETISDGKGGPAADYLINRIIVNVWFWPSVRYVYRPVYRPYVSPWYWGVYPAWWRPRRPVAWGVFSARHARFHIGFRVAPSVRLHRARLVYTPRRTSSVTVVKRYKNNKSAYVKRGHRGNAVSKNTQTKTVVKKGNHKAVVTKNTTKGVATNGKKTIVGKKTTKTTTVRNKKGTKVKRTKTTTVKKRKR